jgi:tetratricopeptide (TPR) repeat protein
MNSYPSKSASQSYDDGCKQFHQSEYKLAERSWKAAAASQERVSPETLDLARTYLKLGAVCQKLNQLDEALHYDEMALSILTRVAPNSLYLAKSYHSLGAVLYKRNQLDDARRCLKMALSIRKRKAPDSLILANTFELLSNVYYGQNRVDKARRYHNMASKIREQQEMDCSDLAKPFRQSILSCCGSFPTSAGSVSSSPTVANTPCKHSDSCSGKNRPPPLIVPTLVYKQSEEGYLYIGGPSYVVYSAYRVSEGGQQNKLTVLEWARLVGKDPNFARGINDVIKVRSNSYKSRHSV